MKVLGCLTVFLCAVVICSGQTDTVPTDPSAPSQSPTSKAPESTTNLTGAPPTKPTEAPPTKPTEAPTAKPTEAPTAKPTEAPTTKPSEATTTKPTEAPTTKSSEAPTSPEPSNITSEPTKPDTTSAPQNTTHLPASSTQAPPESSTELHFAVNNSDTVCLLAQMEVTLSIKYPSMANGSETGTTTLYSNDTELNSDASTKCVNVTTINSEILALNFKNGSELTFTFNKDSNGKISVNMVKLNLVNLRTIFPDSAIEKMSLMYNSSLFETTDSFSYLCNAQTTVSMLNTDGSSSGSSIIFTKVQVQAFQEKGGNSFLSAKECAADDNVSDIVPIAVGCALAGLVVIVLIAYLVGRRQRRQQRGYESV